MEISTKSQAENGADNTTIMTPLRVKQAIKANGGGGGGGTYTAGTGIDITNNVISNKFTKTSDLVNDSNFAVTNANNFFTASQTIVGGDIVADGNYVRNGGDLILTPQGPTDTPPTNDTGDIVFNQWKAESQYGYREVEKARIWVDSALTSSSHNPNYRAYDASGNQIVSTRLALVEDISNYHDSSKQDALVSGTNIKTINNQSLLGSGNLTIQGGGDTYYYFDGQSNAANLAMLNEICTKIDGQSAQKINFTGRFYDGEYNQTFIAPINITNYHSSTWNCWASFVTDPIPWLDTSTTPAKVRYSTYAIQLTGDWGAFTSIVGTYRLDDFANNLYYSGETELFGGTSHPYMFNANGIITNEGKRVCVTIPVSKRLDVVSTINVSSVYVEARGIKGYLNSESGLHEFVGRSGYTVTAGKTSQQSIEIVIDKTSAWGNITNNTPVCLTGQFNIIFN